jgi:hypothetical protein
MSLKAKIQWLVESAKANLPYTPEERESIRNYLHGDASTFNDYLRGKKNSSYVEAYAKRHVDRINSALDKTANHQGFMTHRAIRSNTKTNYKVGNKYIHYGYMSTTKDPELLHSDKLKRDLNQDKLDINMHLKVPKNHPHIDSAFDKNNQYKYQKEMILPHKTRFQVTKIENKGNVKHVHGKVLPYEGDDHD